MISFKPLIIFYTSFWLGMKMMVSIISDNSKTYNIYRFYVDIYRDRGIYINIDCKSVYSCNSTPPKIHWKGSVSRMVHYVWVRKLGIQINWWYDVRVKTKRRTYEVFLTKSSSYFKKLLLNPTISVEFPELCHK